MKLSIITLNYKKSHLTIHCITSLYEIYKKEFDGNTVEVIIVDNASGDNSIEDIREAIEKKQLKNMHLIANPKNSGFGSGNNLGVSKAKGEYMCFLNNDTIVKDTGLLDMVSYMNTHQEVAILGGQLRNFDNSLQPSSGKFYTPFNALLLLLGAQKFGLLDKSPRRISPVDWVKGGLFFIRKNIFEKLHGFDENIFMYTEDMELCYRAKLAGYQIYFYPFVTILHADQGSSNRTFAIVNIYKNLLYFYKKHRSHGEYLFLKLLMQLKAKLLIIYGKMVNNVYLVKTYEEALTVF